MSVQSSPRGTGNADFLLVALNAAFIAVLMGLTSAIGAGVADSGFGANPATVIILALLTTAFLGVALIGATTAVTNAFTLLAAGQVEEIALRRLLGASAGSEQKRLIRMAIRRAVLATIAGGLAGSIAAFILVEATSSRGQALDGLAPSTVFQPYVAVPLVALVLCTRYAAKAGYSEVLQAAPTAAVSAAVRLRDGTGDARRASAAGSSRLLLVSSAVLLLAGLLAGFLSPFAILLSLAGGALAVPAVISVSSALMVTLVRMVARTFKTSPVVHVASRNLEQYPERSARAGMGVLLSVALIAMFVVASSSMDGALRAEYEGTLQSSSAAGVLDEIMPVLASLIGCLVVIGAVSLGNALVLNSLLRTRDLATLRVLGLSRRRTEQVLIAEAAILSGVSALGGVLLGGFLGWAGVQTLLSSTLSARFVVPSAPLWVLPLVIVGTAALAVLLSRAPVRTALGPAPVRALSSH